MKASIAVQLCPVCGATLESVVLFAKKGKALQNSKPRAGDGLVCIACTAILQWQDDGSILAIDPRAISDPAKRQQALWMQERVRDFRRSEAGKLAKSAVSVN